MKFKLHHEEKIQEQRQKLLSTSTAEPREQTSEKLQNPDDASNSSKRKDLPSEESSDKESSYNDDPTPREFTGHPRKYAGWMDREAARQNRATRRWLEKKAGNARRRL